MGNKKCDCKKPTIGNVSSICPIHGIGYFDSYWKKLTHLYNIIFRPKRLWESNGWAELQSTKIFPFISEEGLRGEKFVCESDDKFAWPDIHIKPAAIDDDPLFEMGQIVYDMLNKRYVRVVYNFGSGYQVDYLEKVHSYHLKPPQLRALYRDEQPLNLVAPERYIWQDEGKINPNRFKDFLLAKGWVQAEDVARRKS